MLAHVFLVRSQAGAVAGTGLVAVEVGDEYGRLVVHVPLADVRPPAVLVARPHPPLPLHAVPRRVLVAAAAATRREARAHYYCTLADDCVLAKRGTN
jgi:hypothetical protein